MTLDYKQIIQSKLNELQPESNPRYELTDIGSSRLFADCTMDIARYNRDVGKYFVFNGRFWERDVNAVAIASLAKVFSDAIHRYAERITDENSKRAFIRFYSDYVRFNKRKVLVADAQSEHTVSQNDFDQNGMLLNCQNGTLDLRTYTFHSHRAEDMLTKISNAVYDPSACSFRFNKFLNEVMLNDGEKIRYLQKWCGLALTDIVVESFLILYGPSTRNGKSTLIETLTYALGDYAMSMQPETLALRKKDSRSPSSDIARLKGCRFLSCSEPPKSMLFDTALLKTLLGRDTITARFLNENEFSFTPHFTMFMNTNFLPLVGAGDDTLFSSGRINVLTFDRHFNLEEQDPRLKDALRSPENISGILNWMLEGLQRYQNDPSGLNPPESVIKATEQYRSSNDKLQMFLDECCLKCDADSSAGDIHQEYVKWCDDNGLSAEGKRSFFLILKERGLLKPSATINGKTIRNVVSGYILMADYPGEIPF